MDVVMWVVHEWRWRECCVNQRRTLRHRRVVVRTMKIQDKTIWSDLSCHRTGNHKLSIPNWLSAYLYGIYPKFDSLDYENWKCVLRFRMFDSISFIIVDTWLLSVFPLFVAILCTSDLHFSSCEPREMYLKCWAICTLLLSNSIAEIKTRACWKAVPAMYIMDSAKYTTQVQLPF